jgi:hypothetical protein
LRDVAAWMPKNAILSAEGAGDASSAVPDCWAAAKPVQQNSTDAANGDANKFLLMASPYGRPL